MTDTSDPSPLGSAANQSSIAAGGPTSSMFLQMQQELVTGINAINTTLTDIQTSLQSIVAALTKGG